MDLDTTKPWLDALAWDEKGLMPAIAQSTAGKVLMMAWMNREALLQSLASGYVVYWSRSRQKLWTKGEQSGHRQKLVQVQTDCDGDTLLITVIQTGLACHTGRETCFFYTLDSGEWQPTLPIIKDPKEIYQS